MSTGSLSKIDLCGQQNVSESLLGMAPAAAGAACASAARRNTVGPSLLARNIPSRHTDLPKRVYYLPHFRFAVLCVLFFIGQHFFSAKTNSITTNTDGRRVLRALLVRPAFIDTSHTSKISLLPYVGVALPGF